MKSTAAGSIARAARIARTASAVASAAARPAASRWPCPTRPCPARRSCRHPAWWMGLMVRASPSCAICAIFCAWVGQLDVGGHHADGGAPARMDLGRSPARIAARVSARRARPPRAPARMRPLDGSSTSPTALTAISAPTVTPPTVSDALPMPFMARCGPYSLPTVAPAPAPTPFFLDWAGARGLAGLIARRRVRPHRGVAHAQVEQDRRRHDGHMGHAHVETDLAFFQVAHHAAAASRPNALPPAALSRPCWTD